MKTAFLSAKLLCIRNIIIKRPILAIYDVTKLCNQRCPMCNIRKDSSENMTTQQIRDAAEKLHRFGIGYVFVQGGEPLIDNRLIEIIDIFISFGIKPTVITNGVLLTPDLARQLAQRQCNLAISIDSLVPERYALLRGSDDLDRVLKNVDAVSGIEHIGNWSITTTVSKQSKIDDIEKIGNYAGERGFMFAIRPYIATVGVAGKPDPRLKYEADDILRIFEQFRDRAKRENYLAYLVYCEHIKYIKGEKMPPCDAMKRSMLMKENGCLAPCIELPDRRLDLDSFSRNKKDYRNEIRHCNSNTPCFYNDAREIGIIVRSWYKILFHSPQIIKQLKGFKNFF